MRKTIAKLFAKLFVYTYLERFDCLLTKRIENNKRYKEGKEAVKGYAIKHPKCFFSEHFDEYLELYALLSSMEVQPYCLQDGTEATTVTLSSGKKIETQPIPVKWITQGQNEIMCATDNHWL